MKRSWWILCAAALPLAAAAQMYKWKDARGQIHFTQLPPPQGVPYERLGPVPPPAAAPNQETLNQSFEQAQKLAPELQKAAAEAAAIRAARQQNCVNALERIAYLDAHPPRRLAMKDEQGNISRMTEEEFRRQRAAEEERVKQNCD